MDAKNTDIEVIDNVSKLLPVVEDIISNYCIYNNIEKDKIYPNTWNDILFEIYITIFRDNRALLKGVMTHSIFKGEMYEMTCVTKDGFEWLIHSTDLVIPGKEVSIFVEPENIQIMNKPASEDEKAVDLEI